MLPWKLACQEDASNPLAILPYQAWKGLRGDRLERAREATRRRAIGGKRERGPLVRRQLPPLAVTCN